MINRTKSSTVPLYINRDLVISLAVMNSIQISSCLRKNKYTRKIFRGVFPVDQLHLRSIKKPALLVVNTAVSTHPGKHWVAIYLPKDKGFVEFFDSYGRFLHNKYFEEFFKRFSNLNKILFNARILQSAFSSVCGYYCCVYAVYRAKGKSMNDFIKNFSNRLHENDRKISEMYYGYFKNPVRR